MRILIIALTLLLAGCATRYQHLPEQTEHTDSWEVVAPLDRAFRVYRSHLESRHTSGGGILSGADVRVGAHYYGDSAELEIGIVSTTIKRQLTQVELAQDGETVKVTVRTHNRRWLDHMRELKALPL